MTAPVSFHDAITVSRRVMCDLYQRGDHAAARGAEAVWRALLKARPVESNVKPFPKVVEK